MKLNSKTVIITGANRGLGKHTAIYLAKNGLNVVITYRKNKKEANELLKILSKLTNILVIKCDITNQNDIKKMVNTTKKKFGNVDILINNAGIHDDSIVTKMNFQKWNKVIETNLTGTFNVTKEVLPIMKKSKFGRIINISSFVALTGAAGASNYAASKAGIIGFTKSVAKEIARYNITANVISPGYFDEGMFYDLEPKLQKKIIQQIPSKRLGKPEEIGELITILINSSYITGQVFTIDGGVSSEHTDF